MMQERQSTPVVETKPTRLITARDIASFAKVHVVTVYDWASAGKLPAPVRLGRNLRWPSTVLDTLAACGTCHP